jgi:arylsulfatase A-like enzyme
MVGALVIAAGSALRSEQAAPTQASNIQFDLDGGGGATGGNSRLPAVIQEATPTATVSPTRTPLSPTATPASPKPKYVVIFVRDGARPDYFTVPGIPHIRALMQDGTVYTNAFAGVLQSETPTGHAAIGTGELPRHNGIQGFGWQVPSGNYVSIFNPAYIQDHTMERLMSSAPSLAGILHRAKPGSKVAAVGSYKYYANDALGGPAADYTMYYAPGPNDDYRPVSVAGHVPPRSLLNSKDLTYPTYKNVPLGVSDTLAMRLARETFQQTRSNVIMLNVPEFDQPLGHFWGANRDMKDATKLMQQFDTSLGTIEDAYGKAGVLDQTTFIITADHGFQAFDRLVTPDVINNAVSSVGLKVTHGAYHTADYLWLDNSARADAAAAAIAQLGNDNIQSVYFKEQTPGGSDYIRASGSSLFLVPGMEQANQLLLNSFVGPDSPDVVVMFRDGTAGDYVENKWKGDHGGADWESQHIPLIISGAGARHGVVSSYPARLVDVAPTVLALLGAPWNQMDGTALADALVSPPAGTVEAQRALEPALAADVQAMSSEASLERAASGASE